MLFVNAIDYEIADERESVFCIHCRGSWICLCSLVLVIHVGEGGSLCKCNFVVLCNPCTSPVRSWCFFVNAMSVYSPAPPVCIGSKEKSKFLAGYFRVLCAIHSVDRKNL